MRKPLLLSTILGLLVALSACTTPASGRVHQTTMQAPMLTTTTTATDTATSTTATTDKSVTITREQAINLALQAAGLTRDNVYDLEAELDRERNGLFWEVDFETREHEYSYDIHAQTGAVARVERERND